MLMRNGTVEMTIPLDPRSSPLNRHIVAGADGSVLVGSENGLLGWRAGTVRRMTTKNGLPCDFVITFIQDSNKDWWLYTRCGVVSFSDAELQKWWEPECADSEPRLRCAQRCPAKHRLFQRGGGDVRRARVVFQRSGGTDAGPLQHVATSEAGGSYGRIRDRRSKEFAASDNLEVGPHVRDLQIDYTSPTFSISQKVTFRYKLDGYDNDWHEAGPRRQAFYTDVPPRKYTFRVMAANSDGVWNERAATLTFSIAPAYYQTTSFRAVSAVSFLALLWAAHRYRVRRVQHAFALTLEARVGERTRIARELHDTVLQSLHGLLLRFQTASYLLPDRPSEGKEKLDTAIQQAANAITEGRDAVQGLRVSTVERNDLVIAIRTLGDALASDASTPKPPAFSVAVEGQSRDLHPIVRDEIYKIAAEALRNALPARARRAYLGRDALRLTSNSACACVITAGGINKATRCKATRLAGKHFRPPWHDRARGAAWRKHWQCGAKSTEGLNSSSAFGCPTIVYEERSRSCSWWSRLLGRRNNRHVQKETHREHRRCGAQAALHHPVCRCVLSRWIRERRRPVSAVVDSQTEAPGLLHDSHPLVCSVRLAGANHLAPVHSSLFKSPGSRTPAGPRRRWGSRTATLGQPDDEARPAGFPIRTPHHQRWSISRPVSRQSCRTAGDSCGLPPETASIATMATPSSCTRTTPTTLELGRQLDSGSDRRRSGLSVDCH